MMEMLKARFNEPSTWRGIIALLTAFGIKLAPGQETAVIAAGLAIMGLLGAFLPDTKAPAAEVPK